MADFQPRDPNFEARVRTSFAKQVAMETLGVTLDSIVPGTCILSMPFDAKFCQQHGFLHAGIISAALDSACGYAAFSLMEPKAEVLTVEFKVNLLAPAKGDRFVFKGRVLKSGRTLIISEGEAFAVTDDDEKLIASMTGTMMSIVGRSDVSG